MKSHPFILALFFMQIVIASGQTRLLIDKLEPYELVFQDGKFSISYKQDIVPWRVVIDPWSGRQFAIGDTREITQNADEILTLLKRSESQDSGPIGWIGCNPEYVITETVSNNGNPTTTQYLVSLSTKSCIIVKGDRKPRLYALENAQDFTKFFTKNVP